MRGFAYSVVITLFLAYTLLPIQVHAQQWKIADVNKAREIARQNWGTVCEGNIGFKYVTKGRTGSARMARRQGKTYCIITLNIVKMNSLDWGHFCNVVVHEYGHFVWGARHSKNPNHIMRADVTVGPVFNGLNSGYPGCRQQQRS